MQTLLRCLTSKFEKQSVGRVSFYNSAGKRGTDSRSCLFVVLFLSCIQQSNFISVWNGKGGCLFRLKLFCNDFNTRWNPVAKVTPGRSLQWALSLPIRISVQMQMLGDTHLLLFSVFALFLPPWLVASLSIFPEKLLLFWQPTAEQKCQFSGFWLQLFKFAPISNSKTKFLKGATSFPWPGRIANC